MGPAQVNEAFDDIVRPAAVEVPAVLLDLVQRLPADLKTLEVTDRLSPQTTGPSGGSTCGR